MKRLPQLIAVCVIAILFSETIADGFDDGPISEKEFERLMNEVNTPANKPWRQIPWKISLLDAQNEAAKTGKPIFIWAMDGHPLGCT